MTTNFKRIAQRDLQFCSSCVKKENLEDIIGKEYITEDYCSSDSICDGCNEARSISFTIDVEARFLYEAVCDCPDNKHRWDEEGHFAIIEVLSIQGEDK